MSLLRFNVWTIGLLSVLTLYKSVLVRWQSDASVYGLTVGILAVNVLALARRPVMPRQVAPVVPFLGWGLAALVGGLAGGLSPFMTVVGFGGTFLYLAMWTSCFAVLPGPDRAALFRAYVRLHLVLGTAMAGFGVYQFFVDPTLFGVNPHRIYSDLEQLARGVTLRATSFIGSPQTFGGYMGVMWGLAHLVRRLGVRFPLLVAVGIAGLLSGSGIFFAMVLGFTAVRVVSGMRTPARFLASVAGITIGAMIVVALQGIDIDEAVYRALSLDASGHVSEWFKFLVPTSLERTVFGHGLGVSDRLVEVLSEGNVPAQWVTEQESYLIKVFYEAGLVGIVAFAGLYAAACLRCAWGAGHAPRVMLALLVGLVANLFAAPAFAGLTFSFVAWPLILAPLFLEPAALAVASAPDRGESVQASAGLAPGALLPTHAQAHI